MRRVGLLAIALLGALGWIDASAMGQPAVKVIPFYPEPSTLEAPADGIRVAQAEPAAKPAAKPATPAAKPAPGATEKPSTEAAPKPEPPRPSPDLLASLAGDDLAEAPNMFGDSYFSQDARIVVDSLASAKVANAALPLASADRVAKIAENGNVMPHDRVYFLYNHFDNALDAEADRRINPTFAIR